MTFEKGGTWAGAIEQLEKYQFVPILVRNGPGTGNGNAALVQHGGRPWPEPRNGDELAEAMTDALDVQRAEERQDTLGLKLNEDQARYGAEEEEAGADQEAAPTDRLWSAVRGILADALREPHNVGEVAELLNVSKAQTQAWLTALVKAGELEKLTRPVRYRVVVSQDRLL